MAAFYPVLVTLSLLAIHLASIQALPQSSSNGGDPCGPPGGSPTAISTCSYVNPPAAVNGGYKYSVASSLAASSPSVYGVNCLQDLTGEILDTTSCHSNIENLCTQLGQPDPPRGQWLWSSGLPNCTFGAWIPADRSTSAPIPASGRCKFEILEAMARWCGWDNGGRSDGATVNLKALPTESGGTGLPVDENYLSYIMVAQTFDDTAKHV